MQTLAAKLSLGYGALRVLKRQELGLRRMSPLSRCWRSRVWARHDCCLEHPDATFGLDPSALPCRVRLGAALDASYLRIPHAAGSFGGGHHQSVAQQHTNGLMVAIPKSMVWWTERDCRCPAITRKWKPAL